MKTNFKVFGLNEEIPKNVYFKLIEDQYGVNLIVVDEAGGLISHVLKINKDGFLKLFSNIYNEAGLRLDKAGKIIEDK